MPDDSVLEAYFAVIRARLKAARLARGLRQEDLSEQTGIDLRNIQRLEGRSAARRFNPELRTLLTLANALSVDLGDLVKRPTAHELEAHVTAPKSKRVKLLKAT